MLQLAIDDAVVLPAPDAALPGVVDGVVDGLVLLLVVRERRVVAGPLPVARALASPPAAAPPVAGRATRRRHPFVDVLLVLGVEELAVGPVALARVLPVPAVALLAAAPVGRRPSALGILDVREEERRLLAPPLLADRGKAVTTVHRLLLGRLGLASRHAMLARRRRREQLIHRLLVRLVVLKGPQLTPDEIQGRLGVGETAAAVEPALDLAHLPLEARSKMAHQVGDHALRVVQLRRERGVDAHLAVRLDDVQQPLVVLLERLVPALGAVPHPAVHESLLPELAGVQAGLANAPDELAVHPDAIDPSEHPDDVREAARVADEQLDHLGDVPGDVLEQLDPCMGGEAVGAVAAGAVHEVVSELHVQASLETLRVPPAPAGLVAAQPERGTRVRRLRADRAGVGATWCLGHPAHARPRRRRGRSCARRAAGRGPGDLVNMALRAASAHLRSELLSGLLRLLPRTLGAGRSGLGLRHRPTQLVDARPNFTSQLAKLLVPLHQLVLVSRDDAERLLA